MRPSLVPWEVLPLGFSAVVLGATTAEIVYVTDLTIFTALAPCAASALSYDVMSQTYSNCPEAVSDLQSCVCTKNQNSASIFTALSSSVSYSCGSTASDDLASAQTVLSAYCNQEEPQPTFPPPSVLVTQYITDFPEISYLAPCAASALSYAILYVTYNYCPSDATALATCACGKNQNSLKVSQIINTSAKYSCSSHSADIASAQAVFSAYCNLLKGTSSFPKASAPPGDMSYYITALPQFSKLAPCAASALSYAVFSQTYKLCPHNGPQDVASCVCIKGSMSSSITSSITSNVKYSCDSTASEDVSSAIEVFDFYCSAARAEVTAAGVTESIADNYPTAASGNSAGSGGAKPTGSGSGSGGGGSAGNSNGGGSKGGSNSGTIAGAVIGVVGGIALIAAIVLCLKRRAHKKSDEDAVAAAAAATGAAEAGAGAAAFAGPYNPNFPPNAGKPELGGSMVSGMPPPASPSPSTLKVAGTNRTDNVSPVSAHTGGWAAPNRPELYGQGQAYPPMPNNAAELQVPAGAYPPPNRPELMGQAPGYPPSPNRPELMGQQAPPQYNGYHGGQAPPQEAYGQQIYEVPGQPRPVYEAPSQPVVSPGQPPAPGMGWQAGPVANYHELDGNHGQPR
ncbi:hypothetical protein QBC33DRAFT_52559 [Phialemonium atrogriseum]|uniref:Extracellular membrane protein CFEM domain-containing protein n=1 Tax=Phialemonium atrogriseum TaxID=1093897 RepID=A0AAJ0C2S1_9PEZI|nr:uncharacterized protein QBC33DRAFT_52559 [Phialemonium atrogriseum]KAK1767659.1 hypothetical protein QBC33DRAFT_52559 [Phialemonium atrogriseum]